MQAYVGQTRSKKLIKALAHAGIGECTCPDEFPPRRFPWFLDNGAYKMHSAGGPIEWTAFTDALRHLKYWPQPEFIVVPDIVAGGWESLKLSLHWRHILADTSGLASREYFGTDGVNLYLAVQDGMDPFLMQSAISLFNGLFVGGTREWKWRTLSDWCAVGRETSVPVHVGRCGTLRGVAEAKMYNVDSIDSSFPLWEMSRLENFIAAVKETR